MINSESPAAGNGTPDVQIAVPSSSVQPQLSPTPVSPRKAKKDPPKRSAKATKKPVSNAGNSLNPAEGSSQTTDADPVAPRGSRRLKEKGKVVYSARRGVIKPNKHSIDEDESDRPRKRAAL